MCSSLGTPRCRVTDYMDRLRDIGYTTLKQQYMMELAAAFPSLEEKQQELNIESVSSEEEDDDKDEDEEGITDTHLN